MTTNVPSSDLLLARSALRGIDLALAEDLRETTVSSLEAATGPAQRASSTTCHGHFRPLQPHKASLLDTVVVSPRVAEELTSGEVVEAVQQVLSFSFPPCPDDDDEPSTFSGYIFVSGKQLTWTRHGVGQNGLHAGRITISMREERHLLSGADWLDAKMLLAFP